MIVLGIDPGLAHLGWAAVRLDAAGEELLEVGVVKTDKGKGQGVLVTDDLHRRGQELARALNTLIDAYRPIVVCAESISYPRSAAPAAMLGRSWGVIDAELERFGLPLISASPQAIKKAVTGKKSASKDEVIAAIDARFGGRLVELLERPPKQGGIRARLRWEHPADAVGAVVANLDHDHLRLARAVHARAANRMEASP